MQLPVSTNHPQIMLWHFPHLGNSKGQCSTGQGVGVSGQPVTLPLSLLPDKPWALLWGTVLSFGKAFEEALGRFKFCPHFYMEVELGPGLKSELMSLFSLTLLSNVTC